MSTHYTTYLIPGRNISGPENILELIKNETAVYLRWEFADDTPISLIDMDKDYINEENTLIYVYQTDDSVTPFHTGEELNLKTIDILNHGELVFVFETTNIDKGTLAAFKIDSPAFLHKHKKSKLLNE